MRGYFINDSVYSSDHFLTGYWFERFNINGYPILGLTWNLLLLAVPYFAWRLLDYFYKQGKLEGYRGMLIGGVIFFIWLIFMPNTAYIITDARHVITSCALSDPNRVCDQTFLFIPFFFSYAAIGWVTMVYFLEDMIKSLNAILKRNIGGIFRAVAMPLMSLGVLLGVLNRWNSWEIFTTPIKIFQTVIYYFTQPLYIVNWLGLTIVLSLLYWAGRRLFKIT